MNNLRRLLSAGLVMVDRPLEITSPLFQLMTRFYVADVFFTSGLIKLRDFSSTLALFENEYQVPFLSPAFAAYAGTAAELVLSVLLALGLLSRPAAVALFVFNIVAVMSYPEISDLGRADHVLWGVLMLVTVFFGAGKISADHWIAAHVTRKM